MKSKLIATIFSVAIATCLFAQDDNPGVKSQGKKNFQSSEVSAKLAKLKSQNAGVKNLAADFTKKGFKEETGANNYYGFSETLQQTDGTTSTLELVMQDYKKQGSKDAGTVGLVKMTSGENSESYSFSLVAQDGDFTKVSETKTDKNGNVEKANSWWSCFTNRINSVCGAECRSALTSCIYNTWSGYTACVIARCGWCATKALACCTCNCNLICKGAAGCCDR